MNSWKNCYKFEKLFQFSFLLVIVSFNNWWFFIEKTHFKILVDKWKRYVHLIPFFSAADGISAIYVAVYFLIPKFVYSVLQLIILCGKKSSSIEYHFSHKYSSSFCMNFYKFQENKYKITPYSLEDLFTLCWSWLFQSEVLKKKEMPQLLHDVIIEVSTTIIKTSRSVLKLTLIILNDLDYKKIVYHKRNVIQYRFYLSNLHVVGCDIPWRNGNLGILALMATENKICKFDVFMIFSFFFKLRVCVSRFISKFFPSKEFISVIIIRFRSCLANIKWIKETLRNTFKRILNMKKVFIWNTINHF